MEELAATHVGSVEEEAFEIIDLIHNYPLSADFARWITDGKFVQTIVQEQIEIDKYTRIIQYDLDGAIFFNGKGEFYIDKIDIETIQALTKNHAPLYSNDPSYNKIKKVNVSKIIVEPYHNVISQIYVKGEVVGICWEIYDLPLLIKIYKQKIDPLRYWKKSRRE